MSLTDPYAAEAPPQTVSSFVTTESLSGVKKHFLLHEKILRDDFCTKRIKALSVSLLLFTDRRENQDGQVRQVRPYFCDPLLLSSHVIPQTLLVMRDFGPPLFPSISPLPLKYPARSPFQKKPPCPSFLSPAGATRRRLQRGPTRRSWRRRRSSAWRGRRRSWRRSKRGKRRSRRRGRRRRTRWRRNSKWVALFRQRKGGTAGGGAAGEGGVYVLAYKPVWIHSSQ